MLDIINLNKNYNRTFSLNEISLHMDRGDFLICFGPDDAGKTALIYQIMGLHHFYDGEILFQEKDVRRLTADEKMEIRFVPDSVCMENITARKYFETLSKTYFGYQDEDVEDMCEYFGVDIDCRLPEMTYNENKLTMIIGAMVTNPKLLILDEPLNFMTLESGKKLLDFLKYLSSRGVSILITSEESRGVWEYCNKYVYMEDGSVIHAGDVTDYLGVQKAITMFTGEATLAQNLLGSPVARRNDRMTFIYDKAKQTRSLMDILKLINVSDVEIESLTLEEMINKDYTRWM